MTNLPISEVLDLAADEIEARGWAQGPAGWARPGEQSPLCLEGAIAVASGIDAYDDALGVDPFSEPGEVFNTCPAGRAVREYLNLGGNWFYEPLYSWNDRYNRTQSEVIEVLRAAAAVERAREAVNAGPIFDTEDQPLPLDEKAA